ncbi:hypothetical protein Scep_004579 [Stephania cephalantha]|uniref:Uncharacterized protein n=1 Tax=Stephania cephalantha TaxID=152367 RepID=A0AAP0PWS0_9MAGN
MEARYDESGLYQNQSSYIEQLLQKGGMSNVKAIDTQTLLDKVLAGHFSIHHVPTVDQVADGFTKSLPAPRFTFLWQTRCSATSPSFEAGY